MRHHLLFASTLVSLLSPFGCERDRPPAAQVEPAAAAPATRAAPAPTAVAPADAPALSRPPIMLRGGPRWGNERPRVRPAPTAASPAPATPEARR